MSLRPTNAGVVPGRLRSALRMVLVLLVAVGYALGLATGPQVAAKAPPHATTLVTTSVFSVPDLTDRPIATISPGVELELTGEAAPGFLEVIYGEGKAWIPSTNLTTGVRPGIETAMAIVNTPLRDAPLPESGIVSYVSEGESVILTGAAVDGFYAASYNGAGGWVSGWDIAR